VTLRSGDLRAVLAFVADAHDADGPEPLTTGLLDRLADVVGCEYATYQAFDWSASVVTAYVPCSYERPDAASPPHFVESFWARRKPYPTGGAFRKLSDLGDRRERTCAREANDEFGTVDSIGFRVGHRRTRSGWLSLETERRDFDERDRELALTLQPHVEALWRKAVSRTQVDGLLAALGRDGDGRAGRAIVLTAQGGKIDHATIEARRLLRHWFGSTGARLPHELDEWAAVARPGDRWAQRRNGSVLTIELAADCTLTMRERDASEPNLTARERDVLALVAEGLTNAEIARKLWVSQSTVAKHLEQAYPKLGVHSRTAAVARLAKLSAPGDEPGST
jgi:DNA-binding CsgD family transcriptional regulator